MAIMYGVLRGRPDRYKREDNASTPHLQIRVLENSGQPWRIAVNVQSDTGSDVAFWVVDPLAGHPLLASLPALASGFSTVAPKRRPRARLRQGPAVRLDARPGAAAIRQRQQRRPAGSPVVVPRPVQERRRRDLRVRRQVRPEPPQADRHRVRQHRRSARHSRHSPQPGQRRAARRRQRRVSRWRADPRASPIATSVSSSASRPSASRPTPPATPRPAPPPSARSSPAGGPRRPVRAAPGVAVGTSTSNGR